MDPEVWLRPRKDHYEYIGTHVDDLEVASKDPKGIFKELTNKYKFKLKGVGPLDYHLGSDFKRDKDGALCQGCTKYLDKIFENYARMFGTQPKTYTSPLERGDHPELDTSKELDSDGIKKYQSLIGSLQWAISLGRFDIQTAVMTMSGFRCAPREGHLKRVQRIFGHLSKMRHSAIRYRVERPDWSGFKGSSINWDLSIYGKVKERVPNDTPNALGKVADTSTYVDANLLHDYLTGRSVTGIMHFVNKTPIDSFSKKQGAVETSTYGSEFVAARTAAEQIIDLRLTLRYMGIPIGRSVMFGDNQSVVTSSTVPHSRLSKRWVALSYHRARECIAANIFVFQDIPGKENPADILSKHWGYQQIWPVLQPLLFWKGNTGKLVKKEGKKEGKPHIK